jgi:ribosome-associated toxin RatA of RatAB toxin-antitoxin module
MESARESIVVRAHPAECFAVATDFLHYPTWASDVKEVVIGERDEAGRASVVTYRAGAFGRSTSYTLRYDYHDAPEVIAWRLVEGDITSKLDGRYVFSSCGEDQTEVAYELEAELIVPIPGFVKRRAETKIVHTALGDLKARVEATVSSHT